MSADEPDLGALIARVLPRLAALEKPILQEAGISMWEYAIITELASNPVVSQAELSRRTSRDPTRLGRHIDDLESRGIITRERSNDQRQNAVRLTQKGRTLCEAVKKSIRTVEDEFLHLTLSSRDATRLRHLLRRLAEDRGGG